MEIPVSGKIEFYENVDNGENKIAQGQESIDDIIVTLPNVTGTLKHRLKIQGLLQTIC